MDIFYKVLVFVKFGFESYVPLYKDLSKSNITFIKRRAAVLLFTQNVCISFFIF